MAIPDLVDVLASLHAAGLSCPEEPVPLLTDEPKLHEFVCLPSEKASERYRAKSAFGHGANPDAAIARVIAVAEMIERLSLANPDSRKLKSARYSPSGGMVDPASFCPYSESRLAEKIDYRTALHENSYQWFPVRDMASGEQTAIPAQRVFLRMDQEESFQIRHERNCTGGAVGRNGSDQALRTGLFECLERNHSIRAYLTEPQLPRIVDFPDEIEDLIAYLKRYRLEPYVFDTAHELDIPAVMVITVDESGLGPSLSMGSRCAETYAEAIHRALLESLQGRRSARIEKEARFPGHVDDQTLEGRMHYWYGLRRLRDLRPWLDSPLCVKYTEVIRRDISFDDVIEKLRKRGDHLFVADVTLPEIAEQGFEVLKVVVPKLLFPYEDPRAETIYSRQSKPAS